MVFSTLSQKCLFNTAIKCQPVKNNVFGYCFLNVSLATCVDIDVIVDANISEFSGESVQNFSNWMQNTFNNLTSSIFWGHGGAGFNDSSDTSVVSEVAVVADIFYDILEGYAESELTTTETTNKSSNTSTSNDEYIVEVATELANLQSMIIDGLIDITKNEINSSSDAHSILSVISTISKPVIDVNNDLYNDVELYNTSLIFNMLDIIETNIMAEFEHSIYVTGELESLESTVAQSGFNTFDNIMTMRTVSNENSNTSSGRQMGQSIVDTSVQLSQLVVKSSVPSEYYTFETTSLNTEVMKISGSNYDECSGSHISNNGINLIVLSNEFISNKLENSQTNGTQTNLDCTIMTATSNVFGTFFDTSNNSNSSNIQEQFYTEYVLLDVSLDSASSQKGEEAYLSKCEPIIITLPNTNGSFWTDPSTDGGEENVYDHFPQCSF